jgi:hypothetical protein
MKNFNHTLHILAAVSLTAGSVAVAKADVDYQINPNTSKLETVSFTLNGSAGTDLAGGIGITETGSSGATGDAPGSYVTVCTDLGSSITLGDTYTYSAPVPTSPTPAGYLGNPLWSPNGLQNAVTLFANFGSVLTTGNYDQAAGLQLAVWTALYDSTGVGVINSGPGAYFMANDSSSPGAYADMNVYLAGLASGLPAASGEILLPDMKDYALADAPQDLLLIVPVPEAATIIAAAMLLLSFGTCSLKCLGKPRV